MTDTRTNETRTIGYWRTLWRDFRRYRLGMFGLSVVLLLFLVAFFAPMLANDVPIVTRYQGKWYFPAVVQTFQQIPLLGLLVEQDDPFGRMDFIFKHEFNPERDLALWTPVPYGPTEVFAGVPFARPSLRHLLGTDEIGRDVLARMIHGTGVSMRVGFISMGIAALIGILLGSLAGYWGGWIDMLISRLIEIVTCFPTFFLILAILAWFPPRIENVMIVIGLTSWTGIARYARGEMLRLRDIDYTAAARALGAGHTRVMFRHLLPNSLAPVLISVTFGIASAILVEAGLSWLGFGVQPPQPSWGNILHSRYDNIQTGPNLILQPSVAIFSLF